MRKFWRVVLILFAATVFMLLLMILLIHFTPQPPVSEMENARVSISLAGQSKADSFASKLFSEAKISYDSAMVNWNKENERFLYLRNYEKVALFAELAEKKADEASESAIVSSSNLKIRLIQQIDSLNSLISKINELFYTYPLTSEIRYRISRGKLLLKEAEIANDDRKYLLANRKVTDAEYLLSASYSFANENLKTYFQSYPLWKDWINKTINGSKKNQDYSIIIDKFYRKCLIYHNGIKKYEFDAELGSNWVGNKRVRGDKATPEGMYKIVKKLEGSNTMYYKALLLNYPNNEDIEKFKSEIQQGSLPASAKIGSMIEIHGKGGKGIDWTDGCVAISDKEMEIVYRISKVGTPVTIVGSMNDLKYVANR